MEWKKGSQKRIVTLETERCHLFRFTTYWFSFKCGERCFLVGLLARNHDIYCHFIAAFSPLWDFTFLLSVFTY